MITVTLLCLAPVQVVWASETGDFSLSYGYKYTGEARRAHVLSVIEKLPPRFTFTILPQLVIHGGSDAYKHTQADLQPPRHGFGDTTLGVTVSLPDVKKVSIQLDYTTKLPTADERKELGSGRIDHTVTASLSRDVSERVNLEFDLADYISGLSGGGSAHYFSPDAIVSYSFDKKGRFTELTELDATPAMHRDPADISLTQQFAVALNRRKSIRLSGGVLVGLTPYTSKVGFFVSLRFKSSLRRKHL